MNVNPLSLILIPSLFIVHRSLFIDNDLIPVYQKGEKNASNFSGKRIKRGLYRTASGRLVNGDVNGSLNIMRKAVPNAFGYGIEGVVVHPVRVIPTK